MPNKRGVQTPQERKFIATLSESGDPHGAAKAAGYAYPAQSAHHLMQRPAIQAEMVRVQLERLANKLLPLAVNAIERLLTDARTPAGAVVQAAKLVMDRTLGESDGGKAPHEMNGDELARALDSLRREAADRARPVIDAPVSAQVAPNVLD
jgi:phage terminase small subunit